jgi:rod shape-determining protein MreB
MLDMFRDGLSIGRPALGIDLGTQNTVACDSKGNVIANEPTLVAENKKTKELFFGIEAQKKLGWTNKFDFIHLLSDGTIEKDKDPMVQGFLDHIMKKSPWNKPNVVIAISCTLKERDLKSVELAAQPLVNDLRFVYQPFGAAIGHGIDPLQTQSTIVWDIGHGTTDGLAISDEDNVFNYAIPIAGSEMDASIIAYMKNRHNVVIDEVIARRLKHEVGCAQVLHENYYLPLRSIVSDGDDMKFSDIIVLDSEICEALEPVVAEIQNGLRSFLIELGKRNPLITTTAGAVTNTNSEKTDPEKLLVLLGGGCSQLRALGDRFAESLDIRIERIKDPLKAAAIGAARCVGNNELLQRYAVTCQDLTERDARLSSDNNMGALAIRDKSRQTAARILQMPQESLKTA